IEGSIRGTRVAVRWQWPWHGDPLLASLVRRRSETNEPTTDENDREQDVPPVHMTPKPQPSDAEDTACRHASSFANSSKWVSSCATSRPWILAHEKMIRFASGTVTPDARARPAS